MPNASRIDTHAHCVPDFYAAWLSAKGIDSGGLPVPKWSPQSALDFMDANEVATSILSISTPGVVPGAGQDSQSMARRLNEFTAGIMADNPSRFGYFATVPLPDVDAALGEVSHAFDRLNADGVVLHANTAGIYLGDSRFDPLMDELNRRKAVVFIHPSMLPGDGAVGIAPYIADFLLDSVRAAVNLAAAGTLDRYRDVRFILSHGGGFLPFAAYRLAPFASPERSPQGGMALLKRFYLDTAIASSKYALPSLVAFSDPSRIVFGSDHPYAPDAVSRFYTGHLDGSPGLDHAAINRKNAEQLFPRLSTPAAGQSPS